MSNPKDKAKELVAKMENDFQYFASRKIAIQHAIIAVDEIICSSPSLPILGDGGYLYEDIELSKNYWLEVKTEIEKL